MNTDKKTAVRTWSHAVFIRTGVNIALFLATCQNVGMAAYKFRVLSQNILQSQRAEYTPQDLLDQEEAHIKWMPFLPYEPKFPSKLWFANAWDLTEGIRKLHQLFVDMRVNKLCKSQIIRVPTHDFAQAFIGSQPFLESSPFDKDSIVPPLPS